MRVIAPLPITDAMLTSSTAPEPHAPAAYNGATTYAAHAIVYVAADSKIYESLAGSNTGHTPSESPTWWRILGSTETAYSTGTTYALGDTAYSATTHRVYESLAAGNLNNPLPVLPETQTDKWLDVGPTNRWAAFDVMRNTQTANASPLTIVLTPGVRINSLALLDLDATSASVSMTSSGSPVYSHTEDLNTREVADWYDYFFAEFGTRPGFVLFDLPPYSNGIVTVVITNSGGNSKVGALVIGSFEYLGEVEHEAESDALNFSVVERDAFGTSVLVPRRSVPKTNQTIVVDKERVSRIFRLRETLNAKPAVWSALDDSEHAYFEPFLILGYYRKFTINAAGPVDAIISLELEEI